MEIKTILRTFIIIAVAIIVIIILTIRNNTRDLKEVLDKLNVTLELPEKYQVINERKIIDGSKTIMLIHAVSKDNTFKIQIISNLSEEEALVYINNQKYLINSMFKKQNVPYPGPITHIAACPQEYLPVVEENDDSDGLRVFYNMYANDRLVFGGYDEKSLKYVMVLGFIYCKEKKELFRIEYFTPKENTPLIHKNILQSFRCQR